MITDKVFIEKNNENDQLNNSFLSNLLEQTSKMLKKSQSQIISYVKKLDQNYITSEQTLLSMSEKDMKQLKIPMGVCLCFYKIAKKHYDGQIEQKMEQFFSKLEEGMQDKQVQQLIKKYHLEQKMFEKYKLNQQQFKDQLVVYSSKAIRIRDVGYLLKSMYLWQCLISNSTGVMSMSLAALAEQLLYSSNDVLNHYTEIGLSRVIEQNTFSEYLNTGWALGFQVFFYTIDIFDLTSRYYKGKISGKLFLKELMIKTVSSVAAHVSAAALATVGATIGTAICPIVGSIIGGIIGAFVGSLCGKGLVEFILHQLMYHQLSSSQLQQINPQKMYENALITLNLTKNADKDQISRQIKTLLRLYHPDKEQNQQKRAEFRVKFTDIVNARCIIEQYQKSKQKQK